jgi:hypothetical protein
VSTGASTDASRPAAGRARKKAVHNDLPTLQQRKKTDDVFGEFGMEPALTVQKKPIGLDRLVADQSKPAAASPTVEGWGDDDDLDLDNL